ncbi:MAG TPA: hypothetical protein PKE46_02385 [Micropruina sp.]|nr:hypothetical protein [Micropruina sp.]HMR20961.1 hypothetical protein [Micropruina sp.]
MPNTEEVELVDTITGVSSVAVRPLVNDHLPKQKPSQVLINGTGYRLPSLGRMNRAAVKKLTPLLAKATSGDGDLEALWDLADAMLVDVPTAVVDELTIDDLKAILTEGGLISFTGDDAPDPSNLTITLGESSASTGS